MLEIMIIRIGLPCGILLKHRPYYEVVAYHELVFDIADAFLSRVIEPHGSQDWLSSSIVKEELL